MLVNTAASLLMVSALAVQAGAGAAHAGETEDIASAPDPERFVALYAEACFPERFSFDDTLRHAQEIGWSDRNLYLYDEYNALVMAARAAYEDDVAQGFEADMRIAGLRREDDGRTYFLVVTEVLSEYLDSTACYLYDFEADAPIDPAPVTALLNHPIAYRTDGEDPDYQLPQDEIVSVVWGPPPDYPRMFDTYLTFLPEGSPYIAVSGYSGLVIKSETSLH